MIKRNYFMSARGHYGEVSFRYGYVHTTNKSWLPDSVAAFEYAFESIKEDMIAAGVDEGKIEITCFARC